jgi:hypothetical protein
MAAHLRALTVICLVFLGNVMFSAPGPPPGGGGSNPPCWPPPCIPIDGGIGFLMAAGAAYGAKKFYQSRKEKRKDP